MGNESNSKQVNTAGLYVVPKVPKPPPAKVVSYSASGLVVIQSEFSDHLEELTKGYIEEYKPRGISELCIVRDLASSQCRCEYTRKMEQFIHAAGNEKTITALQRYLKQNEATYKRSLKMLKRIQKVRAKEDAMKPRLVKPKTTA